MGTYKITINYTLSQYIVYVKQFIHKYSASFNTPYHDLLQQIQNYLITSDSDIQKTNNQINILRKNGGKGDVIFSD